MVNRVGAPRRKVKNDGRRTEQRPPTTTITATKYVSRYLFPERTCLLRMNHGFERLDELKSLSSTDRQDSPIRMPTMGPSHRTISSSDRVTDFLQQIIYQSQTRPITAIVCSTREHFLEQLAAAVRAPADGLREQSQLLTGTIGLLSQSNKIRLIFCPTLEHLRAYISVLNVASTKPLETTREEQGQRPLLAVLNILALHIPTSEFSAQGLSRALAAAVEATTREGVDLVLYECIDEMDSPDESGRALWEVRVPLLNNIRSGNEESISKGGSVPVKKVAKRWFRFDNNDQPVYKHQ